MKSPKAVGSRAFAALFLFLTVTIIAGESVADVKPVFSVRADGL